MWQTTCGQVAWFLTWQKPSSCFRAEFLVDAIEVAPTGTTLYAQLSNPPPKAHNEAPMISTSNTATTMMLLSLACTSAALCAQDSTPAPTQQATIDIQASLKWLKELCPQRYGKWTVDTLTSKKQLELDGFDRPSRFSSKAPKRIHRTLRDADIAFLLPLTKLESLDLSRSDIQGRGLATLRGLPKLRKLKLNASKIDDKGILELVKLVSLHELALGNCKQITSAGLMPLAKLRKLRRLELWEAGIAPGWARFLVTMQGLQDLSLSKTRFHDVDLSIVARLPALRKLDLRGTGIEDSWFKSMRDANQLEELWLERTKLTPAILPVLGKMTKLKIIGLPSRFQGMGKEALPGVKTYIAGQSK